MYLYSLCYYKELHINKKVENWIPWLKSLGMVIFFMLTIDPIQDTARRGSRKNHRGWTHLCNAYNRPRKPLTRCSKSVHQYPNSHVKNIIQIFIQL